MPELPEVEIIARALRQGGRGGTAIIGQRVTDIVLADEKLLADMSAVDFRRKYLGAWIKGVERRAKYICVHTSQGDWIFHLRMTGDLFTDDHSGTSSRFQRLCVILDDNWHLRFCDPRRLGKMWALTHKEVLWENIGPEPLASTFHVEVLKGALHSTRQAIKKALLDGRRVAGLGNIWADEALFLASIHPERPAKELSNRELEALCDGIRDALQMGIENTAKSLTWVHRGSERGPPPGQVHLREGEPCPRCEALIARIRVGGRSTYFCPRCQPARP